MFCAAASSPSSMTMVAKSSGVRRQEQTAM
jgi:hypothetical protein